MSSTEALAQQDEVEAARHTSALANLLSDVDEEPDSQGESQRAILNILEDLDAEKNQLESTQRALINMLDDLELERRKVDATNNELQRVNNAMQGFIATAAHELRSPLASMVGFSSLLTDNWADLSEDKRLQFVSTINRQTHKLTWLVNDLLTLSSIDGGALNTQPELVVLADAIAQCLAATNTDPADVSVSCSPDLVVRVDPVHLGRIIENYLQNAFKYGAPPVRIEAAGRGSLVEIRVVDQGSGVPREFEPKLFAKFARADSPNTRNQKGTGLGLSIVRGLAEANDGHAEYERNHPHGSCFIVVLPKDERPRP